MRKLLFSFLALMATFAFVSVSSEGVSGTMPAARKMTVAYIISPLDGATVSNPVLVRFGLSGMGVAPAGVEKAGTGHHHLLINVKPNEIDMENALPLDENYRHFGGGQTEVRLNLAKGKHTLMLLLGDHNHVPHKPPVMSKQITIEVK